MDPPYFMKSQDLYCTFFNEEDHTRLAEVVKSLKNPWVLTYDDHHEIRKLYTKHRQYRVSMRYSVYTSKKKNELMIVSDDLRIPDRYQDNKIRFTARL